jgi:hypothetical protein
MTFMQLSGELREAIIRGVIRQARPRWWKWPFDWFDICPLDKVSEVFGIDWRHRNRAYLLLHSYHCVGYWGIPREVRKAIPELIREALSRRTSHGDWHGRIENLDHLR